MKFLQTFSQSTARYGCFHVYIPEHFREDNENLLREFVRAHSFGVLVTNGKGIPQISHIPMLLEGNKLVGHLARANEQARAIESGSEAVAIFEGPHAYISPSLYSTPEASVPTWNYVVVHVQGKLFAIREAEAVSGLLARLTSTYEQDRREPWKFDAGSDHIHKMLGGIQAFEMEIGSIEGKFKLSQNRPIGDRGRVMWSLKDSPSQNDQELGRWMERLL